MTLKTELGKPFEDYLTTLVGSGRFSSREEALHEALRLLEDREMRLAAVDQAISQGLADAGAGRLTSIDDVRSRFKEKAASLGLNIRP